MRKTAAALKATKPFVSFREAKVTPLYEATPDARGFFEAIGFSDLEDVYIRVSAADQRRYFGCVPFGKCAIMVSPTGTVRLIKTKCFGTDQDSIEVFFDHLSRCWRSTYGDNAEVNTPANI